MKKETKQDAEQPQEAPPQEKHKPLMDLKHILAKNEKKSEKAQPKEVDFYGSMSSIPFLKANKPEEKKKKKKASKKTASATNKEEETAVNPEYTVKKVAHFVEGDDEEDAKKSTEVTITAEYDEDQLRMWKSMSAINSSDVMGRPQEMLPLMPSARPEKVKRPIVNKERAFNRPEEWLNPNLKAPEKLTYFVKRESLGPEIPMLIFEEEEEPPTKAVEEPPTKETAAKSSTPSEPEESVPSSAPSKKEPEAITSAKKEKPDLGALLKNVNRTVDRTIPQIVEPDAVSQSGTVQSRITMFSTQSSKGTASSKSTEGSRSPLSPMKTQPRVDSAPATTTQEVDQPDAILADIAASSNAKPKRTERLRDTSTSVSSRGELSEQDLVWKTMSNADHCKSDRPDDILPLQPGERKQRKSIHKIVGQDRPGEWLSPNEKKLTQRQLSVKIKREWDSAEVEKEAVEEALKSIPSLEE
jgi:hypothetical protein